MPVGRDDGQVDTGTKINDGHCSMTTSHDILLLIPADKDIYFAVDGVDEKRERVEKRLSGNPAIVAFGKVELKRGARPEDCV